jgi:serine/threonine protein kinase
MAPEQTCGETVGPGADCFALGVLIYQMLTGRHPFAHPIPRTLPTQERRTRLFRAIQEAQCNPPSTYDEKIPKSLDEVIMRALARDPRDRHKDGPEMLQALNQVVRQMPEDESVIRYDLRAEDPHTPPPQPLDMLTSTATSQVQPTADTGHNPLSFQSRDDASRMSRTGDTTHSELPRDSASALKQEKPQGVLGRYKLLKQIGHGGQGIVYEAHDAVLDRTVALKVLRKDVLNENNLDELFWHEARVAARLNHPHIITIYDFGIEEKQPYITMQLIDGPSLDRLLQNQKPLPLSFALQVLIQAADAIGFAHEAGIVHLDIKPGNILIRATLRGSAVESDADEEIRKLGRPHVILSDFTMARISRAAKMERQFSDGSMAGTLAYAAPEQLDGRGDVGPVSDLFALGVVFYEMLTGSRLFCSENPMVSRDLILNGIVPKPSSKIASLPPEVDELCARLICRSSQQRLQSAAELISAAEQLMP